MGRRITSVATQEIVISQGHFKYTSLGYQRQDVHSYPDRPSVSVLCVLVQIRHPDDVLTFQLRCYTGSDTKDPALVGAEDLTDVVHIDSNLILRDIVEDVTAVAIFITNERTLYFFGPASDANNGEDPNSNFALTDFMKMVHQLHNQSKHQALKLVGAKSFKEVRHARQSSRNHRRVASTAASIVEHHNSALAHLQESTVPVHDGDAGPTRNSTTRPTRNSAKLVDKPTIRTLPSRFSLLKKANSLYSKRFTRNETDPASDLKADISSETSEVWWSSLESVLSHDVYASKFRKFLVDSYADENLDFYEQVEDFEVMTSEEQMKAFPEIVAKFVAQGADKQVNLPSAIQQVLTLTHPTQVDFDVFDDAKYEVYDLMYKNFFHRFLQITLESEARQDDLKSVVGSYATLWRNLGYVAYIAVTNHLLNVSKQCNVMAEFFRARMIIIQKQIQLESVQHAGYLPKSNESVPKTVDRAFHSAVKSIVDRSKLLQSFVQDMQQNVLDPLNSLETSVRQAVQESRSAHQPILREVDQAHKATYTCADKLTQLRNARRDLVAQHDAASKSANKSARKKIKAKKLLQQVQNSTVQIKEAIVNLDDSRVAAIEATSKHDLDMRNVMDMYESLELHRLETQHTILTQAALVEQNLFSRMALSTQQFLSEATSIDPVTEIVHISGSIAEAKANSSESK